MTPLDLFQQALKYSASTVFVKPDKKDVYFTPLNILLIAGSECGKTRLLTQISCKKAYKTMDLSPKVIINSIIPKLLSKEIGFLVIPDMIQLLGHKKTTTGSTMGFINALIEEGIKDSDFFGLEFHLINTIKAGLLTAITSEEFKENAVKWNNIGFLHRILPISYDYTESTVNNIHKIISNGLLNEINEITIKTKDGEPKPISIPERYSSDIMLMSLKVADRFKDMTIRTYIGSKDRNAIKVKFDVKGFRIHDRLRQLARAICFIDSKQKRKEVNSDDIIKLREISEVFNFPNTKMKI